MHLIKADETIEKVFKDKKKIYINYQSIKVHLNVIEIVQKKF
jgi:hypothetical protein